ncbi:hypothetical protein Hanom_Chr06g00509201 [Helianthus anomalus]
MTIPVGEERKGIRYSDFPDLAKFLLPFRRDIDNPLAAFTNLDDSPMFQKQFYLFVYCLGCTICLRPILPILLVALLFVRFTRLGF